ncbi:hypothetical protein FB446DRAFT_224993 [Lentinula raphanica]|nr:hypothetical protein FB446DRAFT_224993 [Lentinula raphanica]
MTSTTILVSKRFNAPNADVLIHSSDNVQFRLHKQNLASHTGAFPPADIPVDPHDPIVRLTESAATLEILFQYVYPEHEYTSLHDMDFDSLMVLAEAAEKYEVGELMDVCEVELMGENVQWRAGDSPVETLKFAVKYDKTRLIDHLMRRLYKKPLSEVSDILPDHIYRSWSFYREKRLLQRLDYLSIFRPRPYRHGKKQVLAID